jgi:hypothetical protein
MPLLPLFLGLGLGIAAFLLDHAAEMPRELLIPLVSSGVAWGLAALVAGYRAARPLLAGVGTLLTGTVSYYALILQAGRWWSGPWLVSLGRALAFWIAGSVAAGLLLGWLGNRIKNGSASASASAAGVAFGLLAGQGTYAVFLGAFIWAGLFDDFIQRRLFAGLVSVLLAAIGIVTLLLRRAGEQTPAGGAGKQTISWQLLGLTSAGSLSVGTALWYFIESGRFLL